MLLVVKSITKILEPYGQRLVLKSMDKKINIAVNWKQLLDMDVQRRRNRSFLAFGASLNKECKTTISDAIREALSTEYTRHDV